MIVKNAILAFSILIAGFTLGEAAVDFSVSANFSELNDYGEWVSVPGYGTAWRPDAAPDWRPFVYGHWVYSTDGWVWDSDEPFGWIVCHYGNWYYDNNEGWVWLPGNTWSPARVRWYVTDNEIGWAPMLPRALPGYHHNAISMQWSFSPVRYFTDGEVRSHVTIHARPSDADVHVQIHNGPPQRAFVQKTIHTPIVSVNINKVHVANNNRSLVKVEIGNREHTQVDVPVGPRFKREAVHVEPKLQNAEPVRHERAEQQPQRKQEVTIQPEQRQSDNDNPRGNVQIRENPPQERANVIVNTPQKKAQVEVKVRGEDDNKENNDNRDNQDRNRVKVKVR